MILLTALYWSVFQFSHEAYLYSIYLYKINIP